MAKFKEFCDICRELLCDFKRREVNVYLRGVKKIVLGGLTLSDDGSVPGKLAEVENNFIVLKDVVSIPGLFSINAVLCCDDICAVEADIDLLSVNGAEAEEA